MSIRKNKDFGLSGVLISEATDPLLQVFIALSGHLTSLDASCMYDNHRCVPLACDLPSVKPLVFQFIQKTLDLAL